MRSSNYIILVALAGALSVSTVCSTNERMMDAGNSEAESLFNGRDLTGWNGDPLFWRAENGAIVGQTTEETPTYANTFLIWSGGILEDFQLTMDFKLTNHNSGIQYRSRAIEGWGLAGYQADMDESNRYTGMLYEEGGEASWLGGGRKLSSSQEANPK